MIQRKGTLHRQAGWRRSRCSRTPAASAWI